MDLFTLYAIFALINLGPWFKGASFLIGFTTFCLLFAGAVFMEGEIKPLVKYGICGFVLTLLSSLVSVLIPKEDQMWYIVGGYAVTNVEGIQELPENIVGAANAFLEKYQPEATESAE